MEGVGSRMGRASSRYGSTAVFNGPVRRWKKKWVHVSSSSPSPVGKQSSSHSQDSNGSGSLFLCRWTPIPSGGSGAPAAEEEPRRRKFRYTPIAVLNEEGKANVRKIEEDAKRSNLSTAWLTKNDQLYDKVNMDDLSAEGIQESKKSHLDMGLDLEEQDGNDSSFE